MNIEKATLVMLEFLRDFLTTNHRGHSVKRAAVLDTRDRYVCGCGVELQLVTTGPPAIFRIGDEKYPLSEDVLQMAEAQVAILQKHEAVDHPAHYGGKDDPYEAIKVIEAWNLGFHLGNTVKYISRAGKKDHAKTLEDLKKSRWYLDRKISQMESDEANSITRKKS